MHSENGFAGRLADAVRRPKLSVHLLVVRHSLWIGFCKAPGRLLHVGCLHHIHRGATVSVGKSLVGHAFERFGPGYDFGALSTSSATAPRITVGPNRLELKNFKRHAKSDTEKALNVRLFRRTSLPLKMRSFKVHRGRQLNCGPSERARPKYAAELRESLEQIEWQSNKQLR